MICKRKYTKYHWLMRSEQDICSIFCLRIDSGNMNLKIYYDANKKIKNEEILFPDTVFSQISIVPRYRNVKYRLHIEFDGGYFFFKK